VSDKKYVVPEGMMVAVDGEFPSVAKASEVERGLLAAIRWLAENPIAPTMEQAHEMFMLKTGFGFEMHEWVRWGACEWQRRMFEAPEPEVPEAVKGLLWDAALFGKSTTGDHNDAIIEAYRRGKNSK
jgi:hypothetical protein